MTGCSEQLPSWDQARSEADAAMREVVELLSPESVVVDLTDPTRYGCAQGVMYTGHLAIDAGAGFNGPAFVDALPSRLAGSFSLEASPVPARYPEVSLIAEEHGDASVTVGAGVDDDMHRIDILVISRCAQTPDDS